MQVLRSTTALFYPFRKRKKYTRDKSSFFATRFALYILAGWRYALITAYQLVRGKSILPRPEQLISFIPQPFPAERMLRGLFLRIHRLSESGYGSGCMGGVFCREKLGFLSSRRADRFPKPHGLYRHILKKARGGKRSAHKTVNSHNRLNRCVCSCILSCYVIMWNRTHLQIGIYRVDETQRETEKI